MRKTLAVLFGVASVILAIVAGIVAAETYTRVDPPRCPHEAIEDEADRVTNLV